MKKGFFLLAAMAAIFNNGTSVGGKNLHSINRSLKNAPSFGSGGKSSKRAKAVWTRKLKYKKSKARIVKKSRNINHKKAA